MSFLNLFIWWYYIALRSCLPVISIVMVQDIKLTKIRCYVALLLHMYICFRVVYFNKIHHKKSKSVIFLSLLLLPYICNKDNSCFFLSIIFFIGPFSINFKCSKAYKAIFRINILTCTFYHFQWRKQEEIKYSYSLGRKSPGGIFR